MIRRRHKSSPAKSPKSDAIKPDQPPNGTISKKRKAMARPKQTMTIRMKNTGKQMKMTRKLYKEIKNLQLKTHLLIPKLSFSRLVREIMMEVAIVYDLRIQFDALKALQEACEMYMVQFFEDAFCCTLHAKRKTLMFDDTQLTRRLRGRQDIVNH